MNRLNIFVCENFSQEFESIIENNGFDDVIIKPYPCMCENKRKKAETSKLLHESSTKSDDILVICSKKCDIVKLIPEGSSVEMRTENFCFNHLVNDQFINYILGKGGYVIGLGWLNKWREHIKNTGFDRDTAKRFYHDFCKELVFFDAGIDINAEKKLSELSEYLELPYIIIQFEIESLELFVKSAVYEWKLRKCNKKHSNMVSEFQSQCAEYSAILDLMGKITAYTNKRDTIEKIEEIFILVLGTRKFKYWDNNYKDDGIAEEIKDLISNEELVYKLFNEESRFCIKITHNKKVYGVIEVSDFFFPEYIEKYLNFAIEIAYVCGLVLSNIEQYERLLKSEKELKYLSFHDSLTGLYNRTYINEIINTNIIGKCMSVFIFDIDGLKYVNDNFGHLEGDKLIISVAKIFKNCFRETDIVARIGGDEFIAILPDCDIQKAEMLKARINEGIENTNKKLKEKHLIISVSIGFAVKQYRDETVETLWQKADELMYIDKIEKRYK